MHWDSWTQRWPTGDTQQQQEQQQVRISRPLAGSRVGHCGQQLLPVHAQVWAQAPGWLQQLAGCTCARGAHKITGPHVILCRLQGL
jgi:hypothetical protein